MCIHQIIKLLSLFHTSDKIVAFILLLVTYSCHFTVAFHCYRSSMRVSLVMSGSMQDLEGREDFPTPVHDTHQSSQQVPTRPQQYRTEKTTPLPLGEASREEEIFLLSSTTTSNPKSSSVASLTSTGASQKSDLQLISPKASFDGKQQPISVMWCPTEPLSPLSSQQPSNLNTLTPVSPVSLSPLSPCHFLGHVSPPTIPLSSFPLKTDSTDHFSLAITDDGNTNTPPGPSSPPAPPSALSSVPPSPLQAINLATGLSKGITLPQQSERWSIQPRVGHPTTKIK